MTASLRADVSLYDSGGFDLDTRFSPTFVNGSEPSVQGNLRGQDGGAWYYRGANTSTSTQASAQVITTAEGPNLSPQQSVQVTRSGGDGEWAPMLNYTATGMTVKVTWAMDLASFASASLLGPFMGIDGYSGSVTRLGGAGIDASTGEFLFEDPAFGGGFNINAADTVIGLGWHQWEIDYNFSTQTYSASVDGTTEVSGVSFLIPAATVFSDADIATLQNVPPADLSNTGTAYFDNYAVSAVPEPTSLGAALLGVIGCLHRRRK